MTHGPAPHTVALRTRLKPGMEKTYEEVHAVIPQDLDTALRRAGVRSWRIWRDGLDLFHFVEVDDFERMRAKLAGDPADIAWQKRINELLDLDHSDVAHGLGLVWQLPAEA
ncbi:MULTISPECIES: L-rhamnose mutarotase [Amycolatopsis]|uniref:L-rhamnose mutarotase n=1 Tax=Amycolatopsis dendrobii TaxID=2760662 RepID=A0A7W3ZF83_9PSEU|nr:MULTISPECIES: L-rhamnose mutarotase [Amycolatopsis]MBB1158832.1 L-rhamnose mutarotase [Amycolatopsis dendrobii]UKD54996.1 L-rhamnose mutarotase [Amycolatopsis sp. FU40]